MIFSSSQFRSVEGHLLFSIQISYVAGTKINHQVLENDATLSRRSQIF